MILAVLEARCGLSFGTAEVYLNVAGGYRLTDPAADLAVAAALISALSERPIPNECIVFGEIALSGEVRQVAHSGLRLKEAAKLGFERAWVPSGIKDAEGMLRPISATSARSSTKSWGVELPRSCPEVAGGKVGQPNPNLSTASARAAAAVLSDTRDRDKSSRLLLIDSAWSRRRCR